MGTTKHVLTQSALVLRLNAINRIPEEASIYETSNPVRLVEEPEWSIPPLLWMKNERVGSQPVYALTSGGSPPMKHLRLVKISIEGQGKSQQ